MHLLGAAPLNVKAAAAVETEFVFQPFIGQVGDLDAAGLAERLQAAGEVDGVAPKVVGELPAPDDAGDDGAGADANAELDGGVVSVVGAERVGEPRVTEARFVHQTGQDRARVRTQVLLVVRDDLASRNAHTSRRLVLVAPAISSRPLRFG